MSTLSWLSDEALESAVGELLCRARNAYEQVSERTVRNVIDPFSSATIAATFSPPAVKDLVALQEMRSTLSGISNALGGFHQRVLGSVAGWNNHDTGFDLESKDRKIIAEVKNKHNTMNKTNREGVLEDLKTWLSGKGSEWTAYLVIIVPRKPKRYRKAIPGKRGVYAVDGSSFYEIVTGDRNALLHLFEATLEIMNLQSESLLKYCRTIMRNSIPN